MNAAYDAKDQAAVNLHRRTLGYLLIEIAKADQDYTTRYGLVLRALFTAHYAGLIAGIKIDPGEPDWPVVYIELPTGQVSWQMPQHGPDWDGHSTPEKLLRIRRYAIQEGVYRDE